MPPKELKKDSKKTNLNPLIQIVDPIDPPAPEKYTETDAWCQSFIQTPFPKFEIEKVTTENWYVNASKFVDGNFNREALPHTLKEYIHGWKRAADCENGNSPYEAAPSYTIPVLPQKTIEIAEEKGKGGKGVANNAAGSGKKETENAKKGAEESSVLPSFDASSPLQIVSPSHFLQRESSSLVEDSTAPEWSQWLTSQFSLIALNAPFFPKGSFLWERIYPQVMEKVERKEKGEKGEKGDKGDKGGRGEYLGLPIYNPGGKYWVKLEYQGQSIRVEVDDIIPINGVNVSCLPRTKNPQILWPSILTKALLKFFAPLIQQGCQYLPVLELLTGWTSRKLPLTWSNVEKYVYRSPLLSIHVKSDVTKTVEDKGIREEEEEGEHSNLSDSISHRGRKHSAKSKLNESNTTQMLNNIGKGYQMPTMSVDVNDWLLGEETHSYPKVSSWMTWQIAEIRREKRLLRLVSSPQVLPICAIDNSAVNTNLTVTTPLVDNAQDTMDTSSEHYSKWETRFQASNLEAPLSSLPEDNTVTIAPPTSDNFFFQRSHLKIAKPYAPIAKILRGVHPLDEEPQTLSSPAPAAISPVPANKNDKKKGDAVETTEKKSSYVSPWIEDASKIYIPNIGVIYEGGSWISFDDLQMEGETHFSIYLPPNHVRSSAVRIGKNEEPVPMSLGGEPYLYFLRVKNSRTLSKNIVFDNPNIEGLMKKIYTHGISSNKSTRRVRRRFENGGSNNSHGGITNQKDGAMSAKLPTQRIVLQAFTSSNNPLPHAPLPTAGLEKDRTHLSCASNNTNSSSTGINKSTHSVLSKKTGEQEKYLVSNIFGKIRLHPGVSRDEFFCFYDSSVDAFMKSENEVFQSFASAENPEVYLSSLSSLYLSLAGECAAEMEERLQDPQVTEELLNRIHQKLLPADYDEFLAKMKEEHTLGHVNDAPFPVVTSGETIYDRTNSIRGEGLEGNGGVLEDGSRDLSTLDFPPIQMNKGGHALPLSIKIPSSGRMAFLVHSNVFRGGVQLLTHMPAKFETDDYFVSCEPLFRVFDNLFQFKELPFKSPPHLTERSFQLWCAAKIQMLRSTKSFWFGLSTSHPIATRSLQMHLVENNAPQGGNVRPVTEEEMKASMAHYPEITREEATNKQGNTKKEKDSLLSLSLGTTMTPQQINQCLINTVENHIFVKKNYEALTHNISPENVQTLSTVPLQHVSTRRIFPREDECFEDDDSTGSLSLFLENFPSFPLEEVSCKLLFAVPIWSPQCVALAPKLSESVVDHEVVMSDPFVSTLDLPIAPLKELSTLSYSFREVWQGEYQMTAAEESLALEESKNKKVGGNNDTILRYLFFADPEGQGVSTVNMSYHFSTNASNISIPVEYRLMICEPRPPKKNSCSISTQHLTSKYHLESILEEEASHAAEGGKTGKANQSKSAINKKNYDSLLPLPSWQRVIHEGKSLNIQGNQLKIFDVNIEKTGMYLIEISWDSNRRDAWTKKWKPRGENDTLPKIVWNFTLYSSQAVSLGRDTIRLAEENLMASIINFKMGEGNIFEENRQVAKDKILQKNLTPFEKKRILDTFRNLIISRSQSSVSHLYRRLISHQRNTTVMQDGDSAAIHSNDTLLRDEEMKELLLSYWKLSEREEESISEESELFETLQHASFISFFHQNYQIPMSSLEICYELMFSEFLPEKTQSFVSFFCGWTQMSLSEFSAVVRANSKISYCGKILKNMTLLDDVKMPEGNAKKSANTTDAKKPKIEKKKQGKGDNAGELEEGFMGASSIRSNELLSEICDLLFDCPPSFYLVPHIPEPAVTLSRETARGKQDQLMQESSRNAISSMRSAYQPLDLEALLPQLQNELDDDVEKCERGLLQQENQVQQIREWTKDRSEIVQDILSRNMAVSQDTSADAFIQLSQKRRDNCQRRKQLLEQVISLHGEPASVLLNDATNQLLKQAETSGVESIDLHGSLKCIKRRIEVYRGLQYMENMLLVAKKNQQQNEALLKAAAAKSKSTAGKNAKGGAVESNAPPEVPLISLLSPEETKKVNWEYKSCIELTEDKSLTGMFGKAQWRLPDYHKNLLDETLKLLIELRNASIKTEIPSNAVV